MTRGHHRSNSTRSETDGGKGKKDEAGRHFATDKEISGTNWRSGEAAPTSPRNLAKWTPSEAEDGKVLGADFDREARLGANWDQFEANQKLFGVTTSFDESIYTTSIDRSAPDFKTREVHAERLAKEIIDGSSGTGLNVHLAEERGLLQGVDYDEEERYGAVVRAAGEEEDQVPSVQMPPPSSRNRLAAPRKSITSLNASPEAIEAAMHAVSNASATVTRRLSQINEADLGNILSEQGRPKLSSSGVDGASKKEVKLNPDAAEFEPSFLPSATTARASTYPSSGSGYYQQQYQQPYYYGQPQYYVDPSAYYYGGYYPPEAYYQTGGPGYPVDPNAAPTQPMQGPSTDAPHKQE